LIQICIKVKIHELYIEAQDAEDGTKEAGDAINGGVEGL
jgi:hypothetical protein